MFVRHRLVSLIATFAILALASENLGFWKGDGIAAFAEVALDPEVRPD